MSLTGRYGFRTGWFGRPVLQVEEKRQCILQRSVELGWVRRWRDATMLDLHAPELRPLIDTGMREAERQE